MENNEPANLGAIIFEKLKKNRDAKIEKDSMFIQPEEVTDSSEKSVDSK